MYRYKYLIQRSQKYIKLNKNHNNKDFFTNIRSMECPNEAIYENNGYLRRSYYYTERQ